MNGFLRHLPTIYCNCDFSVRWINRGGGQFFYKITGGKIFFNPPPPILNPDAALEDIHYILFIITF